MLLSDNQYGFRSNRSTSLALLELVEKITKFIDDGKYTIGIFIDIKKAFDTIDHNILLQKLHFLGVRGVANSWLTSYLSKRMQYVEVCDCMSDLLQVKCGVPQGSVLGPLLFILYINDICNISKVFDCILFADDTNLFCSDNDINDLCGIINAELDKLNTWFSYCSEIWGGTYDSNIKALILLKKRAIRVVCKCSKYDHTNILFSKLSTLKLEDIIKYKTGIVMYRAYHNILPDNVKKFITTRKSHYNTRNSYNGNFLKFCVHTNLRQMSISYRGINVWNKLDPEVKCATSVSDFKNKFKTQLLGNYIKE